MTCDHQHPANLAQQRVGLAILLNLAIVVAQALIGWRVGSLALLSDAGHNLADVLALGLSAFAIAIARRPPSDRRTYGYHRVGILTALVNAGSLVLMSLWIIWEAYRRLRQPEQIEGWWVIGAAAAAGVLNMVVAVWLHGESRRDINIRSAYLHMVGDALTSAGVLVAGVIVLATGNPVADPIASIIISCVILWGSWRIVREALNVLLEATPPGLSLEQVRETILSVQGANSVHDLHVWTISSGILAASCHITVPCDTTARQGQEVASAIAAQLERRHGITHTTVQVEVEDCGLPDGRCDLRLNGRVDPTPAVMRMKR